MFFRLCHAVLDGVRAGRAERDSAELAYEDGACALLAGAPEEAMEPLRQALKEFKRKNQAGREAQVAWALSHALAATGRAEEGTELAASARTQARVLNLELPWFPGPSDVNEQQRRQVQGLLQEAAMSTSGDLSQELAPVLNALRELPDPPSDQAELLVKGMVRAGGLALVGQIAAPLLNLFGREEATRPLAEAFRQELKHLVNAMLPQVDQHVDKAARASTHLRFVSILSLAGDLEGAREQARQSLKLNQELGNQQGIKASQEALAQLKEA